MPGGAVGALDHAHAAVEGRERLAIRHVDDGRADERAGICASTYGPTLPTETRGATASATVTAGFRCAPLTPADA